MIPKKEISFGVLILALSLAALSGISFAQKWNPFGLMLGGSGLGLADRIRLAKKLRVNYFRPRDIPLDQWTGRHEDTEAFKNAGFKIVMTVRNNGGSGTPPIPSTPPQDIEEYKRTLGQVLDVYRPEILAIENEEGSSFYYLGTPEEYGAELRAACEVAHKKRVKCTNGGMTSDLLTALVWEHYQVSGYPGQAEGFLNRTVTAKERARLRTTEGQRQWQKTIEKGKALLKAYGSAGLDYVNFHWYLTDEEALEQVILFLKNVTDIEPITNEIGQYDTNPMTVQALIGKISELRLRCAVWHSLDRKGSIALQDPDGSLRANGEAFFQFMRENYPKK